MMQLIGKFVLLTGSVRKKNVCIFNIPSLMSLHNFFSTKRGF